MGRCIECHSLTAGDHIKAPSLATIFDNDIAATSYAGYSDALRGKSGRWTRDALAAYLLDPQAFAPGSYMPSADTDDAQVIAAMVEYLHYLDNDF